MSKIQTSSNIIRRIYKYWTFVFETFKNNVLYLYIVLYRLEDYEIRCVKA